MAVAAPLGVRSMGSNHERRRITSQRQERRPGRVSRLVAVGVTAGALLLINLPAHTAAQREAQDPTDRGLKSPVTKSPAPTSPEPTTGYTEAEVTAAANQLFAAVNPSRPDNQYFTQFARSRISWIADKRKIGQLSIVLL